MAFQLDNRYLHLAVGDDGRTAAFTDRATGRDHASHTPFARLKAGGEWRDACGAQSRDGRLHLEFAGGAGRATLAVTSKPSYLVVEVEAVEGDGLEELVYVDLPLAGGDAAGTASAAGSPFAACALALDLMTNVPEIPGLGGRHLKASCYSRFGLAGARVALVGAPADRLRAALQDAVRADLRLPYSSIGGPFAFDAPVNRGSYLFNFDGVTLDNVDAWIGLIHSLGFDQLDFHGGRSFRFGDCRPDPALYPDGFASLKAVIDRLHEAGIRAGLHTYAFFLDKTCPWVTPVPDRRLGRDATFTLAGPLPAAGDEVRVVEPTAHMSAITGFFVRNSDTLQVDDELITYAGASAQPPFGFTGCQRGAWGTRAAAHAAGAPVHHLLECFGLFAPDGDSTLLAEVAAAAATACNECGFDMMYLDALDGEDVLAGGEWSWHYGSKYVLEIWQRLQRPALVEMSTFHHHLWNVRSRMGAWDHPTRSHKRFIDIHCQANQACDRMFLPANLGWWAFKTWSAPAGEPTFDDDIEYWCGKALGTGASLSLMGIDPTTAPQIPALPRLAAIVRRYETLRRSGRVPDSIRQRLAQPGAEFALEGDGDGQRFRPVHSERHKVEGLEEWGRSWTVRNPHAAQEPSGLRIEALLAAGPYDEATNPVLADFADPAVFTVHESANDVAVHLEAATTRVRVGRVSGCLRAANARDQAAGSWARIGRLFAPPIDLSQHQGLGLWVHGDGRGQLLNIQLRSPEHITGALGEHYVVVDFSGWRYVELVEPEGERYAGQDWPYGHLYSIYRESVAVKQVSSLDLWLNQLPPGGSATCYLSAIKALPLRPFRLVRPTLTLGDCSIAFPVELESGSYLELRPSGCRVYGAKGEVLDEVTPEGEMPLLARGANQLRFSCAPPADGARPRARVTLFSQGEPLRA